MSDTVVDSINTGSDLADYEGYIFYDNIQVKLSEVFYGEDGIESQDSYLYKYMLETHGNTYSDIVEEYRNNEEMYKEEAKRAFEEAVSKGEIKIVVRHDGQEIVINNIEEYNREYADNIENIKNEGKNTGDNTSLNAVVINTGGETVGFIEGSNSKHDFEDWYTNLDMSEDFLLSEGSTSQVYLDGWKYIKNYNENNDVKVTKVVGNSQGAGTAVYIGMQDQSIEVVAISPSPQYVGDIVENKEYSNITIIYPSGDPLYNLTKGLGYTVDIPGANIVYVDYGLNKLFNFNDENSNILSLDLNAAHAGDVSAVDYDGNDFVDEDEKTLGIYLDDVIPRSVFTGKEIGTNTSGGEEIVISSDNMNNFADYLKKLHQVDIPDIIARNTKANEINETKIADCNYNQQLFRCNLVIDVVNNTKDLMDVLDDSTGFMFELTEDCSSKLGGINLALLGTNGFKLEKTEEFLESLRNILTTVNFDFGGTSNTSSTVSADQLYFYRNRDLLIDDFEEKVKEIINNVLKLDYVGHKGTYAIGHTLKGIFEVFKMEQEKLVAESLNLESCSRFIAQKFDSLDKAMEQAINDNYMSNTLTDSEELVYEKQELYICSLGLTENMNVVEQFEVLMDEAKTLIQELVDKTLDQVIYFANILIKHDKDLNVIFRFEEVYDEIERAKLPEKDDGIFGSGWYVGIVDGAAIEIKSLIEKSFRPNKDKIDLVKRALTTLPSLVTDAEKFKSTFSDYIEPSIDSLLYDSFSLSAQRDTFELNSQVLQRVDAEIKQASNTLNSQVEFMAKASLLELVKELGLRINALSLLHQDVFGDYFSL